MRPQLTGFGRENKSKFANNMQYPEVGWEIYLFWQPQGAVS